ncbi:hypothetical protein [Paraburkholderia sp. GAS32]|uniref:hypothetical protein n=1 Tax=Paraburkholderia sp. GAS32 TaxID=3035129 RepID=UPI003D1D03D0
MKKLALMLTLASVTIANAFAQNHSAQCSPAALSYRLTTPAALLHDQCGRDAACAKKFVSDAVPSAGLDLSACSEPERAAINDYVVKDALTYGQ